MLITIRDQEFRLEFRYVKKEGKRPQLRHGPVKAITTAVLMAGPPRYTRNPLIAIDNALCSLEDPFSKYEGRMRAFKKLLEHCGAVREFKVELWIEFNRQFGVETPAIELYVSDGDVALLLLPPPRPQPPPRSAKLTEDEVAALREFGAAVRLSRQQGKRGGAA